MNQPKSSGTVEPRINPNPMRGVGLGLRSEQGLVWCASKTQTPSFSSERYRENKTHISWLFFSRNFKSLKNLIGYTLELKPSQIPHKDADQGFFIDDQADVGTVIAFYPGIIYSPAYYRYIPGYPRVDTHNPYLITRYDGTVINAQPWGVEGEIREVWDLSSVIKSRPNVKDDANNKGSDQIWKMLNKPLQATRVASSGDVLERRNPLAFAHFANHPAKEMVPNVMVCPYDFPLTEKDMRTYIPNIKFGSGEEAKMKRFGSFWFKSWGSSNGESDVLVLKALVLVATRPLCDEELLLNYRLSNSKRRQSWCTPVDEEEDWRKCS
ncbi:unnamed protein product [Camellia sinensis]